MDKDTRNAIEHATQRARKLLQDDFRAQLSGEFDVHSDGTVAPSAGPHLKDKPRALFIREKIVAVIEHKRAAGMSAAEAVADYLRDAAFTTLNRFVALKMLEARELMQECITKGEQSAGYGEFCGMAPGVALLSESAGYRLYIECLFDELSTEVKVLFDRRDPGSVLWPKRATFEALLEVLNATDLASVWAEDETIGWVYQFFNSGDERRAMREASQAPRNSRELAVRNQFFTPLYVVQFLTDNTLGRIWYEMREGQTVLVDRCEYLVRRPDETYLPRAKKDPRDIRVLDPACGSGHFLLYAFYLLLMIYEEAFHDSDAPKSEATGRALAVDYPNIDALRRALPVLILAHNLHGVDIDPRCAQIAQLALWMRAQRAWRDMSVASSERPRVRRTNIVVAEPIAGGTALVDEFATRLEPPLLRDLFRKMVSEMRLAGELGTLIPIQEGIATDLRRAREQFVMQRQTTGFLPGIEPIRKQSELDLSGIDDDGFFHEAEARIIDALRSFAEATAGGKNVRRRLFAGDAVQGIALIDLLRTRFDVALMNPPFGDSTPSTRDILAASYPEARLDLYACFVVAALRRRAEGGRVGILSSRLGLFLGSLEEWRAQALLGGKGVLEVLADLGHNVLDGALVEAAAYVIGPAGEADGYTWACGLLDAENKERSLQEAVANPRPHRRQGLVTLARSLPGQPIPYWLPPTVIQHLVSHRRLADLGAHALVGLQTDDDFRFIRLAWEVAPHHDSSTQSWRMFAKGGEYSPYYDDIHLVVQWHESARELKAFIEQRNSWSKRASSVGRYGDLGLTYPERTTSEFSPRPLPEGSVFSIAGPAILPNSAADAFALLSLFYTRWYRVLIEAYVGGGDAVQAGSAARHYKTGIVNSLPLPSSSAREWQRLSEIGQQCALTRAQEFTADETSRLFAGFPMIAESWEQYCETLLKRLEEKFVSREELSREAESITARLFSLSDADIAYIRDEYGPHPAELRDESVGESIVTLLETNYSELCKRLVGAKGYSRQTSKLSHWTDKLYETVAHIRGVPVRTVVRLRANEGRVPSWWASDVALRLLSYWVGVAFGRWRPCSTKPESVAPEHLMNLPAAPFAAQTNGEHRRTTLVDDEGHPDDIVRHVTLVCSADGLLENIVHTAGCHSGSIREYLRTEYFGRHVTQYSKSRRKAPIYWQLSIPSASYSVWLYLCAFTKDTLYKVQNDYVVPKVAHEERRLESLRRELGESPKAAERRVLASQEAFVDELRGFLAEVKRIAPLWNPNLDDGVIINFALLWRLVSHQKAWQKELKATWDALCAGEYDWAHLAMRLWPERVVPKCAIDRSFAIAHGVEDVLWVEGADGKWKARSKPLRPVDELVRERSSPAVKAALKSLLDASPASGTGRSRGRGVTSLVATEGGSR